MYINAASKFHLGGKCPLNALLDTVLIFLNCHRYDELQLDMNYVSNSISIRLILIIINDMSLGI